MSAADRWWNISWQAIFLRQATIKVALYASRPQKKGKLSKPNITDSQLECLHPMNRRKKGGNIWGSYMHCVNCNLRLEFRRADAIGADEDLKLEGLALQQEEDLEKQQNKNLTNAAEDLELLEGLAGLALQQNENLTTMLQTIRR